MVDDPAASVGVELSWSDELPALSPLDDTGSLPQTDPLLSVDVVVIGGGPAGMAAAIEAHSLGADVLLLEREAMLGGAAVYAAAAMMFSGSPIQADAGVTDSPESLLADWSGMTGGDVDDEWVIRFAEDNVSEVYAWLHELGVFFTLSPEVTSGESVPRIHNVSGEGMGLVGLLAGVLPMESVRVGIEATAVLMEDGAAAGVLVLDADGEEGWLETEAVVVATGGFLRNLKLVGATSPDIQTDQVWFSAGPGADGSGHLMLDALGADWENPGAIGVYAHGVPDPHQDGEEILLTTIHTAPWVNVDGERFTDESLHNSYVSGVAVMDQPGHLAWALFDADTAPDAGAFLDPLVPRGEASSSASIDDLIAAGHAARADTLEEVADALGIDAAGLSQTVADTDLQVAPYTALRIAPALSKAFGGISVDLDGAVLADGVSLPGVYAAGELTGMAGGSLVGDLGFTGSLSAVLLSGRVAGRSATGE